MKLLKNDVGFTNSDTLKIYHQEMASGRINFYGKWGRNADNVGYLPTPLYDGDEK
jgi:hypothetical protein